ncbi:MAG: nucleotide exchange factor GrpE [Chitinophagales bacterium]|nr:nucleotide exchange factor GrpE [Chitinophagales bacterium]
MSKKKMTDNHTDTETKKETELEPDKPNKNMEETVTEQEDIDESKTDELEKIKEEFNLLNDKYLRLVAEFDNFRKRAAKEKVETRLTAGTDILQDLLPVLDDLDRAEESIKKATEVESIKEGIFLIKDKLLRNLEAKGLKAMSVHGEEFDPEKHEAIAEFPAASDDLKNKILDVAQKGYVLNDRIIRYPKVVVNK